MQKPEYLTNLPKVTEYDTKTREASKEMFSFMIELNQKYTLTPSQEMYLLSNQLRYISSSCMSVENRNADATQKRRTAEMTWGETATT